MSILWSLPQHLCCKIKNVFCMWTKCWTYEQCIKHEIACSMWSDISELGWKQSCDIWKQPLKYHGFQMSSHLCCKLKEHSKNSPEIRWGCTHIQNIYTQSEHQNILWSSRFVIQLFCVKKTLVHCIIFVTTSLLQD